MRVQSLVKNEAGDKQHRTALAPVEAYLKEQGHEVIKADLSTLPDQKSVDCTILSYFFKDHMHLLKRPVFDIEHGVCCTKDGYCQDHLLANYVCHAGPIWYDRMQEVHPGFKGNLKTGWPKADWLYKRRFKRQRNKKPVIVFAPTFSRPGCDRPGMLKCYETVVNELKDMTVYVCPHERDELYNAVKSPHTVKSADKRDLLLRSDLLISDFSSIVWEYLVLDKPIIQLVENEDSLRLWLGRSDEQFRVGPVLTSPVNLAKTVNEALASPVQHAEERRAWRDRTFYNLGEATRIVSETIASLVRVDG
jgi:hypothetical protein